VAHAAAAAKLLRAEPPIDHDRRRNTCQAVTDSGRNGEYWRLPLEVGNEEHAAEESERLDSDQPMLRNGGNAVAERPRQQEQITDRPRDQQPDRCARVIAEEVLVPTGTNARGSMPERQAGRDQGAPSPGMTPAGR
jgi:hypothetical protein